MPRKSEAALAIVPGAPQPSEPPPRHLSKAEAIEWRKILAGLPRDWIPAGAYCLLEIFVHAVVSMRHLRTVMAETAEGSPRHATAARLYRDEAKTVLRLAKILRLGPRFDRTRLRSVPSVKPWDICGPDGAAPLPPFRGWPGYEPPPDEPAA